MLPGPPSYILVSLRPRGEPIVITAVGSYVLFSPYKHSLADQ